MSRKRDAAKRNKKYSSVFDRARPLRSPVEPENGSGVPGALRLSAKTDVRCYRRETSEDLSDELMRLLRRAAE